MIGPGARLGGYELLARLGAGGQGEVFLARPWLAHGAAGRVGRWALQVRLGAGWIDARSAHQQRLAALKVAHPDAAASLHDEHAHLRSIGAAHPHLACLYSQRYPGAARDLGLAGRRVYLALAHEPGTPLDRVLARRRLPVAWSISIVVQLGLALAHLHQRGIIHHDVRAANVVVRPAGSCGLHAVLIDLGAAETPAAPRRRAVYGTVGHLAPERLQDPPAPATPLVDLFGLGVLLRELTAGLNVSPALAEVVALATEPDPAQRAAGLPTITALLERLAALPEARKGQQQPGWFGLRCCP